MRILLFICCNFFVLSRSICQHSSDCADAPILCDVTGYLVDTLTQQSLNNDEVNGTCLAQFTNTSENQSTWYKWTCSLSGTLVFTIEPIKENDDFDFVLFELDEGISECGIKQTLRCNAAFGGVDFITGNPSGCSDLTGLNFESEDIVEDSNCDEGEDGFLKYLDMEAGKSYALCVNNWSESGFGYKITFDGTGEFLDAECNTLLTSKTTLESLTNNSLRIFPNPAHDIINIEFDNASISKNAILQVRNLSGKIVHRVKNLKKLNSLNASFLSEGIYVVEYLENDKCILQDRILIY